MKEKLLNFFRNYILDIFFILIVTMIALLLVKEPHVKINPTKKDYNTTISKPHEELAINASLRDPVKSDNNRILALFEMPIIPPKKDLTKEIKLPTFEEALFKEPSSIKLLLISQTEREKLALILDHFSNIRTLKEKDKIDGVEVLSITPKTVLFRYKNKTKILTLYEGGESKTLGSAHETSIPPLSPKPPIHSPMPELKESLPDELLELENLSPVIDPLHRRKR